MALCEECLEELRQTGPFPSPTVGLSHHCIARPCCQVKVVNIRERSLQMSSLNTAGLSRPDSALHDMSHCAKQSKWASGQKCKRGLCYLAIGTGAIMTAFPGQDPRL